MNGVNIDANFLTYSLVPNSSMYNALPAAPEWNKRLQWLESEWQYILDFIHCCSFVNYKVTNQEPHKSQVKLHNIKF